MSDQCDHGQDRKVAAFIEHSVGILKRSGARITKPRLAVLECLAQCKSALSPKEILNRINTDGNGVDVDLATVYRILDAFTEVELVHKIGSDGAYMACRHIACDATLHMIAACSSCDSTQEVDLPPQLSALLTKHVKTAMHFQLAEHFLQITGVCMNCAARA
ncbi:MAG: Fur family transcriptional regulator [Proteobacteria bacterium]|nr:Fur family transcriptional regulator [Pseudomonadota bacterium]